ncbi:MAG TPA: ATP-binding protein [Longimicrobiales bacterium]|nr:ATP-binding protein [Longimicrobiales bacterium]
MAEHRIVGSAPRTELEWLASHGRIRRLEPGEKMARTGDTVERTDLGLEIVLQGRFAVWVDRGAGSRRVMEWRDGDISGLLPFSRMTTYPGDAIVDTPLETLSVHPSHFPELIRECPTVTGFCVHVMVDRARVFNTSDAQDEKLASLGKLSAGLAHELNNPASAVARSARLLQQAMNDADRAAHALALVGLDARQAAAVDHLREACMNAPPNISLSPLERADREDEIAEWLDAHDLDQSALDSLAESAVTIDALDAVAEHLGGDALDAALDWVAAGCAVRTLASESERAGTRISELVGAMKRLTHMDQAPVRAPVDVERGLRDTFMVLGHKARAKSVGVRIDVSPDLPPVHAVGGELNQVWMNLLDNALDSVDVGGHVTVTAKPEGRWLVVRVIDDGPGIAPEHRSRIFDPFFTTKPPGEGTGLGLEIARAHVRGNGGDIEFDSRPGRTEFSVSLPLSEAPPSLRTP